MKNNNIKTFNHGLFLFCFFFSVYLLFTFFQNNQNNFRCNDLESKLASSTSKSEPAPAPEVDTTQYTQRISELETLVATLTKRLNRTSTAGPYGMGGPPPPPPPPSEGIYLFIFLFFPSLTIQYDFLNNYSFESMLI